MVAIAWVVLCEKIVRERTNRISLVGVASHMPVPSLPVILNEHLLVARLSQPDTPEYLDVAVGVTTPGGLFVTPVDDDAASITFSGEYLVVRLRSLPLREEGVHRFEIGLSNGSVAAVDVPVWLTTPHAVQQPVH